MSLGEPVEASEGEGVVAGKVRLDADAAEEVALDGGVVVVAEQGLEFLGGLGQLPGLSAEDGGGRLGGVPQSLCCLADLVQCLVAFVAGRQRISSADGCC